MKGEFRIFAFILRGGNKAKNNKRKIGEYCRKLKLKYDQYKNKNMLNWTMVIGGKGPSPYLILLPTTVQSVLSSLPWHFRGPPQAQIWLDVFKAYCFWRLFPLNQGISKSVFVSCEHRKRYLILPPSLCSLIWSDGKEIFC